MEGDDVFSVFQGTLLNGISFDMDRAEIASRMGPSTLFDEAFNAEARGIGNGVRIFLDYDDAFKKIKLIQIGRVLARDMVKWNLSAFLWVRRLNKSLATRLRESLTE
ncbi:hypothetical protein, partial [Burkholderia ubonensis]|uniref:hypothetical protein n=1 Tax=Burkholderia ubonensis TaxID=101571 RepID=UPI0012F731FD